MDKLKMNEGLLACVDIGTNKSLFSPQMTLYSGIMVPNVQQRLALNSRNSLPFCQVGYCSSIEHCIRH